LVTKLVAHGLPLAFSADKAKRWKEPPVPLVSLG
jgi:hypothetical protein